MMVSIGYKNYILGERIVAVVSPDSRPMKNLITNARKTGKLIDATMGKRKKSVIITNSNHVILSANVPETIILRVNTIEKKWQASAVS